MKYPILLGLIIAISAYSCDESIAPEDTFHIGDTITINLNATKYNAEHAFGLTYDRKLAESRCPMDANCIWQGDVAVKLVYETQDGKTTYELHSFESDSTSSHFGVAGVVVQLLQVWPYPCLSCQNIKREDESVVLVVTEK